MSKVLGIILSLGVILGGGGYLLVKEAYAATPADPLFPIQEIADDVQRALTFDEVAEVELEQAILARRQEQVDRMVNRDDVTEEQLETIDAGQAKYGSVDQEIVDEVVQEATARGRTIPSGLDGNSGSTNGSGNGNN